MFHCGHLTRRLSVQDVLDVFKCFLLEKKVLFLSNDEGHLAKASESFMALIYPLKWMHTYIPVLPSNIVEFIQAPLPFVLGLNRSVFQ